MTENDSPNVAYSTQATATAMQNIRALIDQEDLGTIEHWSNYRDDDGVHLKITLISKKHDNRRLVYDRTVEPGHGPDKDASTAGLIYASAFLERMHTRKPAEAKDELGPHLVL